MRNKYPSRRFARFDLVQLEFPYRESYGHQFNIVNVKNLFCSFTLSTAMFVHRDLRNLFRMICSRVGLGLNEFCGRFRRSVMRPRMETSTRRCASRWNRPPALACPSRRAFALTCLRPSRCWRRRSRFPRTWATLWRPAEPAAALAPPPALAPAAQDLSTSLTCQSTPNKTGSQQVAYNLKQ